MPLTGGKSNPDNKGDSKIATMTIEISKLGLHTKPEKMEVEL